MSDERPTERRDPAGARPVQRLRVVVMGGTEAETSHDVAGDRPVAIGAAKDNDLVLSDPTVSRYHLEVCRADGGVALRDLGSLNGTYVGNVRVRDAVVLSGTEIRLGSTVLRLEDGAGVDRPDVAHDEEPVPGLVGRSTAIRQVSAVVRRVAQSDASVLVQGETGTGKEVIARAIHELSPRRDRPFVVVDCGSMPATLVASELFGHERGAFTGADRRYAGAFERAGGGTIFLDEVGELPTNVQPALLGVLERRSFRRIGGDNVIEADVRVVAASHRDLRAEVNTGAFRADLYYRLAVARIYVPPLRERLGDVDDLVDHFVEAMTGSASERPFGPEAMALLRAQRWSGNVRELRNAIEGALAMGALSLEGESAPLSEGVPPGGASVQPYKEARSEVLTRFERTYLADLIERAGGNASKAARMAKMDRPYLLSLLKRHGLR